MNEQFRTIFNALDEYSLKEMSVFKSKALKFLKNNKNEVIREGASAKDVAYILGKKKLAKMDILILCSFPFLTKKTFQIWRFGLEEEVRVIWDELVFIEKMTHHEIMELHKIEIVQTINTTLSHYRDRKEIKSAFSLFKTFGLDYWGHGIPGVYLPRGLRLILKDYYDLPEKAVLKSEEEISETEYLFEKSDEVLLSELSRIYVYFSQKNISVTAKKRPKHTVIPKMRKNLHLREFFSNEKDRKLSVLRTNLLAGLIVHISFKAKFNDPIEFLKKNLIEKSLFKLVGTPALLLTDLKGMGGIQDRNFYAIESPYFEMLKEFPKTGWIDFKRIYLYARYNLKLLKPINDYETRSKLYFENATDEDGDGRKYYGGKYFITSSNYSKAVEKPFFSGMFFMFAALGIVDLAYNRPDREAVGRTCQSAYDELKYVRLTPLGLYLLGRTEAYEVPEDLGETKFVFSPDALTITLDGSDFSAGFVLEPYASKVTPSRYATDTQTFLKGIKKKKELEQKISLFRQVTKVKMPPNWENFFTEMLQKVDPFERLKEDLIVYKLPESNRDLIKLIAQDKYLKGYSMKAEGYHVLVPKSRNAAFKKRLLEFGYLVT